MYCHFGNGTIVKMSGTGIVIYSGPPSAYADSMSSFISLISDSLSDGSVIETLGASRKIVKDEWIIGATTAKRVEKSLITG